MLRPDHIVVVIEEDRAANAIGDPNMPYINQLASSGLVFSNSHGVNPSTQEGEMDYLALYSGSTQGVTDNGRGYTFAGAEPRQVALFDAGLSFAGYSESLPADGSQVTEASTRRPGVHPDLYVRNYNPMAMFTDAGPGVTNAAVNQTFNAFKSLSTYTASLPTVSFVVPNMLHSTHGSNEAHALRDRPGDEYNCAPQCADTWLRQQPRRLRAVGQDAQQPADRHRRRRGPRQQLRPPAVTTIVNGDPRLFVPGTDATTINHYNVLRTIEDMYGLSPLGSTATASGLNTNGQGQLADSQSSTTPPPANQPPGTSVVGQPVTFTARVAPVAARRRHADRDGPVPRGRHELRQPRRDQRRHRDQPADEFARGRLAHDHRLLQQRRQLHRQHGARRDADGHAGGYDAVAGQEHRVGGLRAAGHADRHDRGDHPRRRDAGGVVTFTDGSSTLGTASLNASGVATLTTSSLGVGSHSVAASYAGSGNYAGSASAAQAIAVVRSSSTASLTSSANPAAAGQAVTFTATVNAAAPGAGTPSGTVQFRIDGADFGDPVALAGGSATSPSTSTLAGGNHTITAVYSGDANFAGSTAPALTQTVGSTQTAVATTTTLATSASPAVFGQPVTLTATVAASAGGTPAGRSRSPTAPRRSASSRSTRPATPRC